MVCRDLWTSFPDYRSWRAWLFPIKFLLQLENRASCFGKCEKLKLIKMRCLKKKNTVLYCISYSTTFQQWKEFVKPFQIPSIVSKYPREHWAMLHFKRPAFRYSKCYNATSAASQPAKAVSNCEVHIPCLSSSFLHEEVSQNKCNHLLWLQFVSSVYILLETPLIPSNRDWNFHNTSDRPKASQGRGVDPLILYVARSLAYLWRRTRWTRGEVCMSWQAGHRIGGTAVHP